MQIENPKSIWKFIRISTNSLKIHFQFNLKNTFINNKISRKNPQKSTTQKKIMENSVKELESKAKQHRKISFSEKGEKISVNCYERFASLKSLENVNSSMTHGLNVNSYADWNWKRTRWMDYESVLVCTETFQFKLWFIDWLEFILSEVWMMGKRMGIMNGYGS